jgi:hypothetical protein
MEKDTDRQTDRQTERDRDRKTDRHTYRDIKKKKERCKNGRIGLTEILNLFLKKIVSKNPFYFGN